VLGLVRASLRFFVIGFVAGVLLAPRSGAETRKMLVEKLTVMANQILELAALPPIESERAGRDGGDTGRGRRPRGADARTPS
jgi:hypothetical protein